MLYTVGRYIIHTALALGSYSACVGQLDPWNWELDGIHVRAFGGSGSSGYRILVNSGLDYWSRSGLLEWTTGMTWSLRN